MKLLISSLFILVLLNSKAIAVEKYDAKIQELKALVRLQKDEKMIVFFFDIGNCIKCFLTPNNAYNSAIEVYSSHGKDETKMKILAAVKVNRKKETKVFQKNYQWKYHVYPDINMNTKTSLGLKSSCFLAVFNYDGELLYQYASEDFISPNDTKHPEVIKLVKALER